MGMDFGNYQIYGGETRTKEHLVEQIDEAMASSGFIRIRLALLDPLGALETQLDVHRIIAVGSHNPWFCVYDSAHSMIDHPTLKYEQRERQRLSFISKLSFFAPLIDVEVSDSSWIGLTQYRSGEIWDRFSNGKTLFESWKDDDPDRQLFYGRTDRWTNFIKSSFSEVDLREAWNSRVRADDLLESVAHIFGWDLDWVQQGFTLDVEGIPQYSVPDCFAVLSYRHQYKSGVLK